MIDTPAIVRTEPLHYAALPLQIPVSEIRSAMDSGVQEVLRAILAQGLKPAGALFTHHLRRPTDSFDFEICFPVERAIAPEGRVQPRIWPAMNVARTIHHGSYNGLPAAWGELDAWMKSNGHAQGTEFWEVYSVGPHTEPDPAKLETELNWPVAPSTGDSVSHRVV